MTCSCGESSKFKCLYLDSQRKGGWRDVKCQEGAGSCAESSSQRTPKEGLAEQKADQEGSKRRFTV